MDNSGLTRRDYAIGARPAEAVFGAPTRAIFGADPSAITESIHRLEHRWVVDLAFIGLMPRRHRGALQMTDHRQELFHAADQIAAHNLHVVKVELHPDIRLADLCYHIGRVFDVIKKIIWPIA